MAPTDAPAVAPVLSTPDTHIFDDPAPPVASSTPRLSDEQVYLTYEIEKTVSEIRAGRWRRIALQFPDQMLVDAPRVFEALSKGLKQARRSARDDGTTATRNGTEAAEAGAAELAKSVDRINVSGEEKAVPEERLYILADTSYGACCVDEIAAEHVDADVVVHYGRSCLSPTARLPVIYVFTAQSLAVAPLISTFKETYPDLQEKIILMADTPFTNHVPNIRRCLQDEGYSNVFAPSIIHDPSSPLPNRTVPDEVQADRAALRNYQLFHISDPPTSLLLTLSSRVGAIHIYPTTTTTNTTPPPALLASSAQTLRRRYALLTRLSTVPIFGILINTLSVANYLSVATHVRALIAAAGKKSYTFVVGKVNAAKIANFSDVGGWVVIGCWESSLLDSADFWRPVITPFELDLALAGDAERVWTGEWTGDFQAVLARKHQRTKLAAEADGEGGAALEHDTHDAPADADVAGAVEGAELDSEPESAPPEFDLRTGRYVSHTRPMRPSTTSTHPVEPPGAKAAPTALTKRAPADLATIGGQVSPAAEFLRSQRTWQGLGSDFAVACEREDGADGAGARVEEGRRGVARGYVVGEGGART
ncbi:hypothetical protein B0A49_05105 [Cryomyces minteri]|uniref:2-(3-amino-3-carboxypropyl)histidine synthase subunit 2 n=1 Tax=Cryomyces minteri TaxID=331657 RepID=A0A4U0WY51_9PEZI|nr:hypothetical protein B0A49_05105 [Cryomyces minteri]